MTCLTHPSLNELNIIQAVPIIISAVLHRFVAGRLLQFDVGYSHDLPVLRPVLEPRTLLADLVDSVEVGHKDAGLVGCEQYTHVPDTVEVGEAYHLWDVTEETIGDPAGEGDDPCDATTLAQREDMWNLTSANNRGLDLRIAHLK